jgi:pimeloyl-ACP methyl ester carboxylesterase
MRRVSLNHPCQHIPALRITLISLFFIFFASHSIQAQNEFSVLWQKGYNQWLEFTDSRNFLYNHLSGQAFELLENRREETEKINSLAGWQQRQKLLKETLMELIGPFPDKSPLNAKIVRTADKSFLRVEHIIYESQPGFYVTSSLFIPAGLKKKSRSPVIIFCSGHSANGYRYINYQNMILNLVKKGFMVFAFDPVGQGERIEYLDTNTGRSILGGPTKEHSYPATQAFITGSSQARYMIWDGIRAVDYLLTRTDIDPARIGITGCSGGGTQTALIAAMDERIFAAVPQCYITSFRRLFQSIGPQDGEQNIFNGILRGIDHADLLAVRAPKPALVMSTTEDMFSIQGAHETVKEVSAIYSAYGKSENFGMTEDAGPHGTTKNTREVMYAFFRKHFNNPGPAAEEKIEPLSDEELRVSPTGQISTSFGGETVFSLNLKEADRLNLLLDRSRADLDAHLVKVPGLAKRFSGYIEPELIGNPVLTGYVRRDGYVIGKYFIKGEGNYVIPYIFAKPDNQSNKTLLYLHPSDKSAEASAGGEIEWFVKNGFNVLAPDLVGIGETGPGDFKGDANFEGISFNTWYASILVGRSIVGTRTGDVIRLVRLIQKDTGIKEIYGLARKEMAPVLLHAAAFDNSIAGIALIEPYSSYRSVVTNRYYKPEFIHNAVPAALKAYDLPDLAASIAPRRLLMTGITDGNGKKLDNETGSQDLKIIRAAYKLKNAEGELKIAFPGPDEKPFDLFRDWIK